MTWTARYLLFRLASIAVVALGLSMIPEGLNAQSSAPTCFEYSSCRRPAPSQINYLCTNIFDRTKDEDENSPFVYLYEKTLWEMVGARPKVDSTPVAAARIRILWQRYHDDFICDSLRISVPRLLTFVVHDAFWAFLRDAVDTYHLDLNVYDPSVKGTVLDYIDGRIAEYRSKRFDYSAVISELEWFRTYLIKAGAKHSSELTRPS